MGICIAQAFDYCATREKGETPTFLFILDEFASALLPLPEPAASLLQSENTVKNVRFTIITQALVDLDILYGQKIRDAILSNICYKVILGITDPQSQKYFANIIEQREVRTTSTTTRNNCSTSYTIRKEYRVPPEAFGHLRDHRYIIYDDGNHIKLGKNYYFKGKHYIYFLIKSSPFLFCKTSKIKKNNIHQELLNSVYHISP